jgi:hypothetical protein
MDGAPVGSESSEKSMRDCDVSDARLMGYCRGKVSSEHSEASLLTRITPHAATANRSAGACSAAKDKALFVPHFEANSAV